MNKMLKAVVAVGLFIGILTLHAETNEQYQQQLVQASANADKAMQAGPATIALSNLATLNLPEGYGYIPAEETRALFKILGNNSDENVMGIVVADPKVNPQSQWMVVLTYNPSGHILDDDAKDWDVEKLLSGMREGTEEMNKVRHERGFQELDMLGWIDKPQYDAKTNQLLWSIKTMQRGNQDVDQAGINFNTLALSREGYMSMNLVTKFNQIDHDKVIPGVLLKSLHFNDGYKYTDFNIDTDKVAEYGLAALVMGVAAKKVGLFAMAAVFLLKFSKIIMLSLAGIGGIFFSRRKAAKKKDKGSES